MTDDGGYRRILKSSSLIGSAEIGSILIGFARLKALALLTGPAGVGLFGILTIVMTFASSVAACGVPVSGVREMAANTDPAAQRKTKQAIWTLAVPLAVVGALIVWGLSDPIAAHFAGGSGYQPSVALIAAGVFLAVIAATQTAILQGHRQIGALAKVRLIGTALAAFGGVWCVWALGSGGIKWAVIAVPAATLLVGAWYARRLPASQIRSAPLRTLQPHWRALIGLGFAFVITGLVSNGTQLLVRGVISSEAGLAAAGLFQAAWSLSSANVALILTAMAADYYPRLSEVAGDRAASEIQVNQQLRIALTVAIPLLLGLLALASLAMTILFTTKFLGAAPPLRLLLTGEMLKLVGWALGFALAANRDVRFLVVAESSFLVCYTLIVRLLIQHWGIEAAGAGYIFSYVVYVALVSARCWYKHRIGVSAANWMIVSAGVATALALNLILAPFPVAGAVLGVAVALLWALWSMTQLARMVGAGADIGKIASLVRLFGAGIRR